MHYELINNVYWKLNNEKMYHNNFYYYLNVAYRRENKW